MSVNNNDIVRVWARFGWNGLENAQYNAWYLKSVAGVSIADATFITLMAARFETIYTYLLDYQSTKYYYESWGYFNVTQETIGGEHSWPTLTAGIASGDMLSEGVSAYGFARTGVPHRIGKKFFGGFTETSQDTDGEVVSAAVTAVLNTMQEIYNSYLLGGSYGFLPGLYHPAGEDPVEDPAVFTPVSLVAATNRFHYLNRRRLGVGV